MSDQCWNCAVDLNRVPPKLIGTAEGEIVVYCQICEAQHPRRRSGGDPA